jgi:GR25 family glycosyltransferase involved in LPS biosynthesis
MALFDNIYLPIIREETTDGYFLTRRVSKTLLTLLNEQGQKKGTDDIMGLSMYVEQHIDDFKCLDHLLKLRKIVLHMHPNTKTLRIHFSLLRSILSSKKIDASILRYPL